MATEAMGRSEQATTDALQELRAAADKCRTAMQALKESGIRRTAPIRRALEWSAEAAMRGHKAILMALDKWGRYRREAFGMRCHKCGGTDGVQMVEPRYGFGPSAGWSKKRPWCCRCRHRSRGQWRWPPRATADRGPYVPRGYFGKVK